MSASRAVTFADVAAAAAAAVELSELGRAARLR